VSPFQSLRDYEEFVYTLPQNLTVIRSSSLVVIRRGKRVATLQGELTFAYGYRIVIRERLSYDDAVEIAGYGYELWHNAEKIALYDSQPHPDDPTLARSYPHHKHIPPNIKRNRIPAPQMSLLNPTCRYSFKRLKTSLMKSNLKKATGNCVSRLPTYWRAKNSGAQIRR
jgi:hypothetical protein